MSLQKIFISAVLVVVSQAWGEGLNKAIVATTTLPFSADEAPKPAPLQPPQSITWKDAEIYLYWAFRDHAATLEIEKAYELIVSKLNMEKRSMLTSLNQELRGHKTVVDMLTKKLKAASADTDTLSRLIEKRKEIMESSKVTLGKIATLYQEAAKAAGFGSRQQQAKASDEMGEVVVLLDRQGHSYKMRAMDSGHIGMQGLTLGKDTKNTLRLSDVFPAGVQLPESDVDLSKIPSVEFTPVLLFTEEGKFLSLELAAQLKTKRASYASSNPVRATATVQHILRTAFAKFN